MPAVKTRVSTQRTTAFHVNGEHSFQVTPTYGYPDPITSHLIFLVGLIEGLIPFTTQGND